MSGLLQGPVLVVGTGLLGTSVALACREAGLEVLLRDVSSEHVRTASGLGAGVPDTGAAPQLVVVAVPPDHLGAEIAAALAATDAVVTDVGSVKSQPLAQLKALGVDDLRRYVGSHPMAGSERSGPLAASATLFEGRPWALTPHQSAEASAIAVVRELIMLCGAVPVDLSPDDHDRAVARVSHLPQLMSSLVAGRLAEAPSSHLALSGQGVRDVTRIAGSDPTLWKQIITANSEAVLAMLDEVEERLARLRGFVAAADAEAIAALLAEGVAGTRAIPAKHGGVARPMASVFVSLPDQAGELARLFAHVGAQGVSIEDVHIDHDPGRPVGLVELVVEATSASTLVASLTARGWVVHP
ncbi:prephenate dehydrogenase [Nocardioides dubius]|uniref:Prephenate dehydrogenase n=1 Tax=Nocardioides dubius TaxID=317019 RepID=A0ABN1TKU3_9ACTN